MKLKHSIIHWPAALSFLVAMIQAPAKCFGSLSQVIDGFFEKNISLLFLCHDVTNYLFKWFIALKTHHVGYIATNFGISSSIVAKAINVAAIIITCSNDI